MSVSFGTWSHTASVTGKKQAPKYRMNKEDKQHNIHTEHTHITHIHTTRTTLTQRKLAQRTLTQRTITQRTLTQRSLTQRNLTQRSLTQRNSLLHVPKRHLSTTNEKHKSKPVHTHTRNPKQILSHKNVNQTPYQTVSTNRTQLLNLVHDSIGRVWCNEQNKKRTTYWCHASKLHNMACE